MCADAHSKHVCGTPADVPCTRADKPTAALMPLTTANATPTPCQLRPYQRPHKLFPRRQPRKPRRHKRPHTTHDKTDAAHCTHSTAAAKHCGGSLAHKRLHASRAALQTHIQQAAQRRATGRPGSSPTLLRLLRLLLTTSRARNRLVAAPLTAPQNRLRSGVPNVVSATAKACSPLTTAGS